MRARAVILLVCLAASALRAAEVGPVCGVDALIGAQIGDIPGEGACGVADAVQVQSVAGVRLAPEPTVTCGTARALHDWVTREVQPAAEAIGARLAGLEIAAHYTCRNVNRSERGKLSEHAYGRAIDIAAFALDDGRRVTVAQDWGAPVTGWMLRWVRAGACGHFTTTIGPGSDAFHEDHFHFDMAERRNPYCK